MSLIPVDVGVISYHLFGVAYLYLRRNDICSFNWLGYCYTLRNANAKRNVIKSDNILVRFRNRSRNHNNKY